MSFSSFTFSSGIPSTLPLHPDIIFLPCQRYIHQSAHWCFHTDNSKSIILFWTFSQHPSPFSQSVDHSVLAGLLKMANPISNCNGMSVHFGLLNIRLLVSKGHLLQDIFTGCQLNYTCLTETWQQLMTFINLFSQHQRSLSTCDSLRMSSNDNTQ